MFSFKIKIGKCLFSIKKIAFAHVDNDILAISWPDVELHLHPSRFIFNMCCIMSQEHLTFSSAIAMMAQVIILINLVSAGMYMPTKHNTLTQC